MGHQTRRVLNARTRQRCVGSLMPRNNIKLPRHDSDVDFLIQSQACYPLHHGAKALLLSPPNEKPRSRGASGSDVPHVETDLVTRRAASPAVAGPAGPRRVAGGMTSS